jgi:hypothetical protein
MPYNMQYTCIPGVYANSTGLATSQYLAGHLSTTSSVKVLTGVAMNSTTTPTHVFGVIMNKPGGGEEVEFAIDGIVKAIASTSSIAVGDRVAVNTTGRVTDAGTTDNIFFLGRALEAASAAGDIITIKLAGLGGSRY